MFFPVVKSYSLTCMYMYILSLCVSFKTFSDSIKTHMFTVSVSHSCHNAPRHTVLFPCVASPTHDFAADRDGCDMHTHV